MKKRITSGILALCMLISLFPVTALATYSDIDGHWGEEAIEKWSEYGIVEGDGKNFNPDGLMTRGAAAAVFARLLGLSDKADISKYTDVNADAWYADAIAMCVEAGIMSGVAGNLMDPNGPLTREQFFVMYARALGIEEEETMDKSFNDAGEISDWAQGSINALVNKGFIDGISDGTLAPDVDINRASVISLLDKSIAAYVNEDNAEVTVEGNGIVLVVADNVTIKGEGDITLVAATDGEVEFKDFEGEVAINIVSDGAEIKNAPADAELNVKEGVEDAKVNDKVVDETTNEVPSAGGSTSGGSTGGDSTGGGSTGGGSTGGGSTGGGSTGGGSTGGDSTGGGSTGGGSTGGDSTEGNDPAEDIPVQAVTGINNIEKHGSVWVHVDLPEDKTGIEYFTFTFYDSTNPEASRMEGITCNEGDPTFYVTEDKFDSRFNYDRAEVTSLPLEGYEKAVYTENVSINIEQITVGISPVFVMPTDGNPNRVEITLDNALTPGMLMHIAVWENAEAEQPIMNTNIGEYNDVSSDGLSVSRSVSEAESTAIQAGNALISIDKYSFSAEKKNDVWTLDFTNIKSAKTAVQIQQPQQPSATIENVRFESENGCVYLKWDAVANAKKYEVKFTTDGGTTWGNKTNAGNNFFRICLEDAAVYNGVKISAIDVDGNVITTAEDMSLSLTVTQGAALEWGNRVISLTKVKTNEYDMEITGMPANAHYDVKFVTELGSNAYSKFGSDADANGVAVSTISSSKLDNCVENGYYSIIEHDAATVTNNGKTVSVTVRMTEEKKCTEEEESGIVTGVYFSNCEGVYLMWNIAEDDYNQYNYDVYLSENGGTDWTFVGSVSDESLDVMTPYLRSEAYATVTYNAVKIVASCGGTEVETFVDKEISLKLTPLSSIQNPTVSFKHIEAGNYYTSTIKMNVERNTEYRAFFYDTAKNPVSAEYIYFNNYGSGQENTFYFANQSTVNAIKNGYYEIAAIKDVSVDDTGKSATYKMAKTPALVACTPSDSLDVEIKVIEGTGDVQVNFEMPAEYDSVKLVITEKGYSTEIFSEELNGNVIPDITKYLPHTEYNANYSINLVGIKSGVKQDVFATIPVAVTVYDIQPYSYEMVFGSDGKNHTAKLQPRNGALKLLASWNDGMNVAIPAPTEEMNFALASDVVLTDGDYISISAILSASVEDGMVNVKMTPAAKTEYEEIGQAWLNAGVGDISFNWSAHPTTNEYAVGKSYETLTTKVENSTVLSILEFIVGMKENTAMDVYVESRYPTGEWARLNNAVTIKEGSSVDMGIIGQADGSYKFETNVPANTGRMFVFEMVDSDGNRISGYNGYYGDSSTTDRRIYVMPNETINVAPYEGCTFNVYQYDWTIGANLNTIEVTRSYKKNIPFVAYEGFVAETEVRTEAEFTAAINKSGTVKLMSDITLAYEPGKLAVYANRGGAVTLDLNGYNLHLDQNINFNIENGKQMTIKNGTITGYVAGEYEDVEGVNSSSKIMVGTGSYFELLNGTYVNVEATPSESIVIKDAVINGYVVASAPQVTIENVTADSVTIDGKDDNVEVKNSTMSYLKISNGNNAQVSGITGLKDAVIYDGVVEFNDVTMTDGYIDAYMDAVLIINSGDYRRRSEYGLFSTGFNTIIINGGTFNFDPEKYLGEDKTATANGDGTWTVE